MSARIHAGSLVLGLTAGLVVALVTSYVNKAGPDADEPEQAEGPVSSAEVALELGALRRDLAQLRAEIASRPPTTYERVSATRDELAMIESITVAEELRALRDLVGSGRAALGPSERLSTEQDRAPGYSDRDELFASILAPLHAAGIDKQTWARAYEAQQRELGSRHHFWTLTDLVERYGIPDVVRTNGDKLALEYHLPKARPDARLEFVQIDLVDGIVVRHGLELHPP